MILVLLLMPILAGMVAFFIKSDKIRRGLLLTTAFLHLGLTTTFWSHRPGPLFDNWLSLDAPGLLFLSITSFLFGVAAVYGVGYLIREESTPGAHSDEGSFFPNTAESVFTGCLLIFLATMTLVPMSQHLGLLWVAIESTTLASAPLIYFHRHHQSLEATWKYLLICSVGIALALLGNFCIAVAASHNADQPTTSLLLSSLVTQAKHLEIPWLKAGFLCLLVGYGTKMGLAPLHTWLPDAHSESPSVVSALLSGALLNCAFLAILRAQQICLAAGLADFGRNLLIGFGLISMVCAAVFILEQADYKRMLAYSSVEHMGILSLGVGLGGGAVFGSMFHAINHSASKAMLFLVAGNLLTVFKSKSVNDVRGALRVVPVSAALWVVGLFAITGFPPFGTFLSEFIILKGALAEGRYGVAVIYLATLAVIFAGMSSIMLKMAQSNTAPVLGSAHGVQRESFWSIAPPAVLGMVVLLLGVHLPTAIDQVLHEAAMTVGGSS